MATKMRKISERYTFSQLNIAGLVATIRDTNPYSAIVEAISNSIHSIEAAGIGDGQIEIELIRDEQSCLPVAEYDNSLPEITSVKITDNGAGFNDENLQCFNEAYTQHKVDIGGKGFGRFVFLKHFEFVRIVSEYADEGCIKRREFQLGDDHQIVKGLTEESTNKVEKPNTTVYLEGIKNGNLNKHAETVSRKLLEKLLIFFISSDSGRPRFIIVDSFSGEKYVLNDLLGDSNYSEIQKIDSEDFCLARNETDYSFQLHIFKIWFTSNQQSKICLVANRLEASETSVADYINEFESGFVGDIREPNGNRNNHFIIKAYVTGDYLDENVDRERVGFHFGKNADGHYPIGRSDIEETVSEIIKKKYESQFKTQRNKKEAILDAVVKKKPWLKRYEHSVDLAAIKVGASEQEYEMAVEACRLAEEHKIDQFAESLISGSAGQMTDEITEELIKNITKSNKDDLARYVARRKAVIDILGMSLRVDRQTGKYEEEKILHDIVYPMHQDSDHIGFDYQNLWLLDERLNYTEYISSDKPFSSDNMERADLFIFHNQVAFRSGDEKQNPITIVEFKRPGREDFASSGVKDNPVDQIIRYTNAIRDGKYEKPNGRPIYTDPNTQFYGYAVVELTEKVKRWLREEEDFTPMPDGLGYFKWKTNISLYIEVISWDKLLKDAILRNSIFAQKLGL